MLTSRLVQELNRRVFDITVALYRVTDVFPQGEALRSHMRSKAGEIFECAVEYGHTENWERELLMMMDKIRVLKGYLAIGRGMRYVKPVNFTILEREYDFIEDMLNRELFSVRKAAEEMHHASDTETYPSVPYEWPTERVVHHSTPHHPVGRGDRRHIPEFQRESPVSDRPDRQPGEKREQTPPQKTEQGAIQPMSKNRKQIERFFESSINARQQIILEYLKHAKEAKISDLFSSFSGISTKTIQRDLQNLVDRHIIKKEGEKKGTIYALRSDYLL